jgi:uncharacterized membrane protein
MSNDLDSLREAVRNLDQRLAALETRIFGAQASSLLGPDPISRDEEAPPADPRAPDEASGRSMGQLLAVVATICFILAGAFIVKLAIDSGWLTPIRQWALLVGLGFSLIGAGRFFERIELEYRSYLSAAGIVILYIASFASSRHFDITSPEMSLVLAVGVSGLCLSLFNFHRSFVFPLVAAIGTYVSPLIVGRYAMDPILQGAYFLLWAALFSWFSTFFRSRQLAIVSAYLGLGVYTLSNLISGQSDSALAFVIAVQVAQFAIFSYGTLYYTTKSGIALSERQAWAYFPVLCFFYGTTYYFLSHLWPTLAPWIALVFALFVLSLYRIAKRELARADALASQEMVHSFLAVVLFQAGYLQLMPDGSKPWLLAVFLIASYLSEQNGAFPRLSRAFVLLGSVIGLFEFLKICYGLLSSYDLNQLLAGLATLVIGIFYYLSKASRLKARASVFLVMVHVLAVLALYRLANDHGSLVVSMAWALYALLILGLGYSRKDPLLARSSLTVLLVASFKALLYDASQAPTGVRILCLLLTGVLLYGAGVLFQKMAKWSVK